MLAYLGFGVGSFPESELAAKQTLALPVYPELTDAQTEYVVECIRDFYAAKSPRNVAGRAGTP
jgi:dTDP-4-amino-4,6-dideoxygalactose transaminase